MAVFTGSAGQAVTFTVVIAVTAATVPVGQVNQRTGIRYITLQLPGMAGLLQPWLYIRTVLSPVLRQRVVPVFKPRAFRVVFGMVLQRTAA